MRTKTHRLIIAALVAATFGSVASAGPHHRWHGEKAGFAPGMGMIGGGPHRIERMAEHLDLTTEQREVVEAALASAKERAEPLTEALKENHQQLGDMAPENYDAELVSELAEEQGALVAQLAVIRAETKRDVFAVLTEEQRIRIDEHRQHRWRR